MKKLRLLLASLAMGTMPACITVQDSVDDACDNCAGANPDENMSTGGTSIGGSDAKAGSGGADIGGGSGAPDEGAAGESGTAPSLPTTVSVEVLGALIGPGKVDQTTWDGTGTVPPEILMALADAFGYPGVDKIVDVIQQAAYQALSKPDPFGSANLNPDGSGFDPLLDVNLATEITNTEDTFTPIWPMPYPGWNDLPFEPGMEVRVTLYDEDLSLNDDIGIATITYEDILEAWTAGDSHWIRVEDMTNDQILAIQIQVSGIVE